MARQHQELLQAAAACLPDWFAENMTPLPWRAPRTPYRTLVSEIMLQQTRTAAVIPYFERFMQAFPGPEALAAADEDAVLKLWEGLGYYSRARNLHRAARQIVYERGGVFPESAKELRTLRGVGDYTAGAIASLCFGEPCPAVDGNVLRVIARYLGLSDDIMQARTKKEVSAMLTAVYPAGRRSGLLTEALMELGETVCIPNGEPRCLSCPLAEFCVALRENKTEALPVRSRQKPRRRVEMTVLVLRCGDRYAIRKRPEKGLLGGLWEFPNREGSLMAAEATDEAVHMGADPSALTALGQAVHIFTHIEWHMTGYLLSCREKPTAFAWVTKEELLQSYALPRAFRHFADALT